MTHFLRLYHDAILIGAGTAKADNPSLNCRYPGATADQQPRPIIIGSSVSPEWLGRCKAKALADQGQANYPWSVCARSGAESKGPWRWEGDRLEMALGNDQRIDLKLLLEGLGHRGIGSVMIEGGASVINELLRRPDLVDSAIITIAPTFLGSAGVQVAPPTAMIDGQRQNAADLKGVAYCQFGQDMVLCGRLQS